MDWEAIREIKTKSPIKIIWTFVFAIVVICAGTIIGYRTTTVNPKYNTVQSDEPTIPLSQTQADSLLEKVITNTTNPSPTSTDLYILLDSNALSFNPGKICEDKDDVLNSDDCIVLNFDWDSILVTGNSTVSRNWETSITTVSLLLQYDLREDVSELCFPDKLVECKQSPSFKPYVFSGKIHIDFNFDNKYKVLSIMAIREKFNESNSNEKPINCRDITSKETDYVCPDGDTRVQYQDVIRGPMQIKLNPDNYPDIEKVFNDWMNPTSSFPF